ncbi:hypothetical protein PSEUBRA_004043 [Kalmanozyma brasiliensis GHG001]|uniref:uncharacterized protein n=1 Tax=Kalmanozyma brasiliensis (strain GHG001) TaxID=1365824 RepID=UPI0028683406|nr:uncharacterized protein PSEUBRA_004043 [Kalmanozyma brasiliensis GHG001]KAF6767331.1 hypothetical protein PSEUBRA_004043 [Kalmanozyma brasiliensis GHG001]
MRLFALILALLATFASHASPLAGSFERVIETASDRRSDAALTELTLGRDWGSDVGSSLIRNDAFRPGPFGFNENSPVFSHSSSSSFRAPSRSSEKAIVSADAPGPSSSRLHTEPATRPMQAAHVAGEGAPQLDTHFLATLRQRSQSPTLLLPTEIVYVRPPWLTEIYNRIVAVSVHRVVTPFHALELAIPAATLAAITSHTKHLISARTDMYALRFPRAGYEPVEVLLRFHSNLVWENGEKVYSVMSMWSTTGGGEKTALLGVCKISLRAFERLVRMVPGAERFGVQASETSFSSHRLAYELVPKPLLD